MIPRLPSRVALICLCLSAAAGGAAPMPSREPDRWGLTIVGEAPFAAPPETAVVPVPNGGFETGADGRPDGWSGNAEVVDAESPEGNQHLRAPLAKGCRVTSPPLPVTASNGYLLSCWLRSSAAATARFSTDAMQRDRNLNCIGGFSRDLPATDGKWKRVGLYFLTPAATTSVTVAIQAPAGEGALELDEVRLRTATREEYVRAFDAWRTQYPPRDLSPRPTDGRNLTLSLRKLRGEGVPGKPFVIWAVGSSYTNMLGSGELLLPHLYRRFPNAPPIIYKKHCGASSSWLNVRGWVRQFVIPDQPDLVLTYTIGKPADLEKLILDLRQHTTADIMVPSIHWRMRDEPHWGNDENAADQDVEAVRSVCRRYGVEFVESRREWREFMLAQGFKLEVDPAGMLKDPVHESNLGAVVINENLARHFSPEVKPTTTDALRERLYPAVSLTTRSGAWRTDDQGRLRTSAAGARLALAFRGNGCNLVGLRTPGGGAARVLIDGRPAAEAPAFASNHLVFARKSPTPKREFRGLLSDRAPHAVLLGPSLVPQSWTLRMVSADGDFEVVGSVTGPDGRGNNRKPFTSHSGQLTLDPALWRYPDFNVPGDEYQFDVWRSATNEVSFAAEDGVPATFWTPLVHNLPLADHTLELVTEGNGQVTLVAFHTCTPPGSGTASGQ